jgi:hypothetical protein
LISGIMLYEFLKFCIWVEAEAAMGMDPWGGEGGSYFMVSRKGSYDAY